MQVSKRHRYHTFQKVVYIFHTEFSWWRASSSNFLLACMVFKRISSYSLGIGIVVSSATLASFMWEVLPSSCESLQLLLAVLWSEQKHKLKTNSRDWTIRLRWSLREWQCMFPGEINTCALSRSCSIHDRCIQ